MDPSQAQDDKSGAVILNEVKNPRNAKLIDNVMKEYYVYIMASKKNGTLYIGVTSDLVKRVYQHKNKLIEGFSSKYNTTKLVYFEKTTDVESALKREKQLKGITRAKKIAIIVAENKEWNDLSATWY